MARRVSSPVFIGRSDELNALLSLADRAKSAQFSIALVGGEAGVGKSRLVTELGTRLHERGWLVLEGGSVALGDDSLLFGPIIEALRKVAREVDREKIVAAAGPSLPDLTWLVPELRSVAGEHSAAPGPVEGLEIRMFEGVLRLLGHLSEATPVLLVLEDLHWSDRSTRDLLSFLARNARSERMLTVATIRTNGLNRLIPVAAWLAEVERHTNTERIDLRGFERDELFDLLTAIAGRPPTGPILESIVQRSGGNALFAEELAAAGSGQTNLQRGRLPETLRAALHSRLSATSEQARRLVEIAAVAGYQVDHEVLLKVSGLSDVEVEARVREAIDAHLLVVGRDVATERYEFRHALVQEVAYDELLPSERRSLHAAYAQVIEARSVDGIGASAGRLVELSHHWTAANDPSRALAAATRAGDALRMANADNNALRQYERAIDLWGKVPAAAHPADRDLADLYDLASELATAIGEVSRGVNYARREIELLDADGAADTNLERRARARERLSRAASRAGDTATSIRAAEEAVGLYQASSQSPDQARVLAWLAGSLIFAGRSRDTIPFAERAVNLARATQDKDIESLATNFLGVACANLGSIARGIDLLRRAVALADATEDPAAISRSYANLGSVLEMGGLVEEALQVSLTGAALIRRRTLDPRFVSFLEVSAAGMLIDLGRYGPAGELLAKLAGNVFPGESAVYFHSVSTHLALRTGDLVGARRHLGMAQSAEGLVADAQFLVDVYAFGAEIALWERNPEAALVVAREGFDRLVDIDFAVIVGNLAIQAARAAADVAVKARARRDLPGAETAVGAARDVIERYRKSTALLSIPDALAASALDWRMTLCMAELARAMGDDDPTKWDSVVLALRSRPAPFVAAYALLRRSEALADGGDLRTAAQPLRESYAIAATIGASLLVDLIESLSNRIRVELKPVDIGKPGAAGPLPPTRSDPFGLSAREREVLPLVARGYTNRRIAETLFISESTAGVHVSHILGKLGVVSRTEAAAVAVRLGLDRGSSPRGVNHRSL